MNKIKAENLIVLIFLCLFFCDVIYSTDIIIQICTVRNEKEEGIRELKELSAKRMACDPQYKSHKEALLWACNNLGIYKKDNPPPEFPAIYGYNSISDNEKIRIAKELVKGNISAVLIIEDIHPDIVDYIWDAICEEHNFNKDKFLAISFVIIPGEVIGKMNEYMGTEWYGLYKIPSFEYFTYRKIDTAKILAAPPVTKSETSMGNEITVTATTPVIDTTKSAISTSIDRTTLESLPSARNPWTILSSVPSMKSEYGAADASAAVYNMDGINVNDPAFGILATNPLFDSIEELQVSTSTYGAEYGGPLGSIVAISTKSGGNEYRGEFSGYFTLKDLTEESPFTSRAGGFLGYSKYDLGLSLGGPILKNKVWFFSWYVPNWMRDNYKTLKSIPVSELLLEHNLGGNINWQVSSNHRLTFRLLGTIENRNEINQTLNVVEPIRYNKNRESWNINLGYYFIINTNFFLDNKIAFQQTHNKYNPKDNIPLYEDGTSDGRFSQGYGGRIHWGGSSISGWDKRGRLQENISLSWFVNDFLGDHEIKFGAEYIYEYYQAFLYPSGPGEDVFGEKLGAYWRIRDWGYYNRYYIQNSRGNKYELSFYAQDAWSIASNFTFTLGLRATQYNYKGYGEFAEKIKIGLIDTFVPRIGFNWDIMRDGKSVLYGHYGKFYESIPLHLISRILSREQYDFCFYHLPMNGQLPSYENPGVPITELYDNGVLHIGENINFYDFSCQYSEEATLGIRYDIYKNVAVALRGIYRNLGNAVGPVSFDEGNTYTLTNPSGYHGIDPQTGETIVFPALERKFLGLEFTLNKRFSNNYQFFISYLLSKNEGNVSSPFYQTKREVIPDITSLFYFPELLENAYGLLEYDRTHQLKVLGSYRFSFGLIIGGTFAYSSGIPLSKLGEHPSYGTEKIFIVKRGSAGRSSPFYSCDLRFEYPIKFEEKTLYIILDILNLTNRHSPIQIDQEWNWAIYPSNKSIQTNPYWGDTLLYQSPRVIRFALRFCF